MRDRVPRISSKQPEDKYAINEQITSSQVRVIGADGQQIGVLSLSEAIDKALQEGLDLVEVAPEANPPVCRILDYGKLKYREQKKAAETRKKSSFHTVKELRVRYSTDKHDLETKVRNARRFIQGGDRVRFQMRFRGREVSYKELGENIFKEIASMLEDIAVVEEFSPLIGQRMIMVLATKGMAKQVG